MDFVEDWEGPLWLLGPQNLPNLAPFYGAHAWDFWCCGAAAWR